MTVREKIVGVFPTIVLAMLAAHGYERELTSLQVRDAVFLGRGTSARTTDFLKDYVQTFSAPRTGVYLSRAEVATPYKQIVERTRRAISGSYSPLDAQRDYEQSPRRIVLDLTFSRVPGTLPAFDHPTRAYYDPAPLDLIEGFTYALFQGEREVPAQVQLIDGIYNCGFVGCVLVGVQVQLGMEVADVESAPLELEVADPDEQVVRTRFDLHRLR